MFDGSITPVRMEFLQIMPPHRLGIATFLLAARTDSQHTSQCQFAIIEETFRPAEVAGAAVVLHRSKKQKKK